MRAPRGDPCPAPGKGGAAAADSVASSFSLIISRIAAFFDRILAFFRGLFGGGNGGGSGGGKPVDVPAQAPETISSIDDGEEMRLVWHDEFNGDTLDDTKWTLMEKMYQSDIRSTADERNLTVEDGKLVMRTWKESNGKYSTSGSVTTDGIMSFQYGYLEICANVPFVTGGWPSFWMQSKDAHRTAGYMTEIDAFEVYNTTDTVSANIHKWYPGGGEHYQLGGSDWKYKISSRDLNNEYHLYGFGWTPEKMYFTVDRQIYKTYDLSQDFGSRGDGMQGFHDLVYIIFNNYIFTNNSSWKLPPVNSLTDWPITYKIDWVRLYQKDGEGRIFDDTGY